jgi:hypothetical protein
MIGEEKSYLALCQKLQEHLPVVPLKSGAVIARGYADVGFEECLVLTNGTVVSVLTGKPLEVTEEELKKHYFLVPDIEDLCHVLSLFDLLIEGVEYQEQRWWVVNVRCTATDSVCTTRSRRLHHAFLIVLAESLGFKEGEPARLKVVSSRDHL